MAVQYSEIQELLRSRADLNARLSLDGLAANDVVLIILIDCRK